MTETATSKGAAPQKTDKTAHKRPYLSAEERRRSIIVAAQKVFSRTSLQGARTRDLAEAAGINQATLYGHFESKEALFVEAVIQPMVDAMKGMYERAEGYQAASSKEALLDLARASSQSHLASMVEIFPLLVSALFSEPELGRKLYVEHMEPMFKERGDAMRNVVRDDIDPNRLSVFAFGIFFAVAMDRFFTGDNSDLSDVVEQITNLCTFGFASDEYRE